jgi:hypothetical protein
MFRIAQSLGAPKWPLGERQIRLNAHRLVGAHSASESASEGVAQTDPARGSEELVDFDTRSELPRNGRDPREGEKVQEIH